MAQLTFAKCENSVNCQHCNWTHATLLDILCVIVIGVRRIYSFVAGDFCFRRIVVEHVCLFVSDKCSRFLDKKTPFFIGMKG